MTYPILPRSLDSSGTRRYSRGYGIVRTQNASAAGFIGRRLSRSKVRNIVELSWDRVGVSHIDPLLTLVEDVSASGIVVCPTFQREIVLESAWSNSGTQMDYDPALSRTGAVTFNAMQANQITIDSTNNKINFIETSGGSEVTATLSSQTVEPATVAADMAFQMNAATALSGTPYTVNYNLQDDRFEIETSSGYLDLLWFSGTNAANACGRTVGFDVSRDQTGGTEYKSQYFFTAFGSRVLISDPSDNFATSEILAVSSLDTGNNQLNIVLNGSRYSAPAAASSHTYPAGSIVEPVFNAHIDLQSQDSLGDSIISYESSKGQRGIISASARFVEAFNA